MRLPSQIQQFDAIAHQSTVNIAKIAELLQALCALIPPVSRQSIVHLDGDHPVQVINV